MTARRPKLQERPHGYPIAHRDPRYGDSHLRERNLYANRRALLFSPALAAGSSGAQAPAALGLDQLAAHLPERSLDLGPASARAMSDL